MPEVKIAFIAYLTCSKKHPHFVTFMELGNFFIDKLDVLGLYILYVLHGKTTCLEIDAETLNQID